METSEENHASESAQHALAHITPAWLLVAVWALLLALTAATVGATRVDFGGLNLWIALAIATVKAILVLLYFMHLRNERPLLGIIFITALVFVFLFVAITLIDTQAYAPDLIRGYAPKIPQ